MPQASALRLVLGINAAMFVIEFAAGWIGQSTALIADSFDMLADAVVYGLSLAALSRTMPACSLRSRQRKMRLTGSETMSPSPRT